MSARITRIIQLLGRLCPSDLNKIYVYDTSDGHRAVIISSTNPQFYPFNTIQPKVRVLGDDIDGKILLLLTYDEQ